MATSEDVSGLATEADTLEALNDKLPEIIPELLILNGAVNDWMQSAILIAMYEISLEII